MVRYLPLTTLRTFCKGSTRFHFSKTTFHLPFLRLLKQSWVKYFLERTIVFVKFKVNYRFTFVRPLKVYHCCNCFFIKSLTQKQQLCILPLYCLFYTTLLVTPSIILVLYSFTFTSCIYRIDIIV